MNIPNSRRGATAAEERLEGEYEYAEVNVRPAGTSLPLVMSTSEETTFQYFTLGTLSHIKHHHHVLQLIFNRMTL